MGTSMRTLLVASLAALALSAPAAAQNYAYGTTVGRGDYDYTPLAVAVTASVCGIDEDGDGGYDAGEPILLDVDTATCATNTEVNDVRLSASGAGAAGTSVRVGDRDFDMPVVGPLNDDLHYHDADGDADFGSRDTMYLDLVRPASLRVDVGDLRLTRFGDLAPGTIVRSGDPDVGTGIRELGSGAGRDLMDANVLYLTGGSAPFKSGRTLYVNVDGGAIGTADLAVEANAIRLTPTFLRPFGGKPDVKAANLTVAPAQLLPGAPFQVSVEVRNEGDAAGTGLVATRLDSQLVDARATPTLEPGARAVLVATLLAPLAPGRYTVEAEGLEAGLTVAAAPTPPVAAGPSSASRAEASADARLAIRVQDLELQLAHAEARAKGAEERVAALEDRLATAVPGAEPAPAATGLATASAPGPGGTLLVGALAAAALLGASRQLRRLK